MFKFLFMNNMSQPLLKIRIFFILFILTVTSNAATIKGRVIDSDTHDTVRGVVITILGLRAKTVSNVGGRYTFDDLRPGTYTISARCIGYELSIPQDIDLTSPEAVITFDIYIKPVQQINGGLLYLLSSNSWILAF